MRASLRGNTPSNYRTGVCVCMGVGERKGKRSYCGVCLLLVFLSGTAAWRLLQRWGDDILQRAKELILGKTQTEPLTVTGLLSADNKNFFMISWDFYVESFSFFILVCFFTWFYLFSAAKWECHRAVPLVFLSVLSRMRLTCRGYIPLSI